jgi:Alpha/beta hydrolase
VAATADAAAAGRLTDVAGMADTTPPAPPATLPPCTATPADVRRWWDTLTPAQQRWLAVTDAAWLGALDGVPAAFRDAANRLLLDRRRADLDTAAPAVHGRDRRRLHELRHGLRQLADRLAQRDGPRAYLLRLDLAGDGRAVVALGDPDRADNVLTHVPGMTADLESYGGELARAERVAVRAAELGPGAATSTVMWLDYDAPDFVDEAAGAGRARTGAAALRHFQDGLRATHDGSARLTVLGHSYGSLVVGHAASDPGLAADDVVFVGSPGVGVEAAAELHVPAGHVWSTTSRSDVIQYLPVAPASLASGLVTAGTVPVIGPALAFATPEDDLWFGRNPSDPSFGAHVFGSQPDAGHVGYWDRGRPALDAIAEIALGTTP